MGSTRCLAPLLWLVSAALFAAPPDAPTSAKDTKDTDQRILGLIPNYQTVSDPKRPVKPMTAAQKRQMFLRESADPFNLAGAVLGASMSQAEDAHPRYGQGSGALADRFGAAAADLATQTFFTDAVLAPLFHQDIRYFRKGPGASIPSRVLYAASRVFITRQDSGKPAFNISAVLGMGMGMALSNAYYPDSSVGGSIYCARFRGSLISALTSNLLPEFWPDISSHLFHRKKHAASAEPAVAGGN